MKEKIKRIIDKIKDIFSLVFYIQEKIQKKKIQVAM